MTWSLLPSLSLLPDMYNVGVSELEELWGEDKDEDDEDGDDGELEKGKEKEKENKEEEERKGKDQIQQGYKASTTNECNVM